MKAFLITASVVVALAGTGVHAQSTDHEGHQAGNHDHPAASGATGDEASMTEGEVRKVDRDARKLTLRHGPIANLDMADMTMVFRVTEPTMLEGLEAGKKVRFTANLVGGQLTVTRIEVLE